MRFLILFKIIGVAMACQKIFNCHECVFKSCKFILLMTGEVECTKVIRETGVMGVAKSPVHCDFLGQAVAAVKEIARERSLATTSTTEMSTVQRTEVFQQPATKLSEIPSTQITTTASSTSTARLIPVLTTYDTATQNSQPESEMGTEQATDHSSIPPNELTSTSYEGEYYTTVSPESDYSFTGETIDSTTEFTEEEKQINHLMIVESSSTSAEITTKLYGEDHSYTNASATTFITEDNYQTTDGYSTTARTMGLLTNATTRMVENRIDEDIESRNEEFSSKTMTSTSTEGPGFKNIRKRKQMDKLLKLRYIEYSNSSFFNQIPKTRFCTSTPTNIERYVGILCQIEKYKYIAGRDSFPGPEYVYLMLNEARYHRRTCNFVNRRRKCNKRELPKRGPKGWGAVYPRTSILYDALQQTLTKDCSKYARKETNLETLARMLCQLVAAGRRIKMFKFNEREYGYYLSNPALNYGDVCETLFYRKRYCAHKYFI